jgi:hypothetical protein
MSKLGIAYNLFDGLEILEDSLKSVRETADYICAIYQEVSNWGNTNPNGKFKLKELYDKGLLDDVFLYEPYMQAGGHVNEIHKRQIGLERCLEKGCDVFMSMDADEIYKKEEFSYAYKEFVESGHDSSACMMKTYYNSYSYELSPPENYYVSLFFKVVNGDTFRMAAPFPVLVDPTRRLNGKSNSLIFDRNQIEMYHMSYVRDNVDSFISKLRNSSASVNFSNENFDRVVDHYKNWKYPQKALTIGMDVVEHNVVEVDNTWIKTQ